MDKLEPVSSDGDMDHADESSAMVVAGGDGAVDFEAAEEAFDMIAFLVERPVVFDLDPAALQRLAAGNTQRTVAALLGLDQATISRLSRSQG